MAQRRTKNSDHNMWFCDFRPSSARHLTEIDHATYIRTCKSISPYAVIPGWTLGTCLRDFLHVVYLGTAKDIIPSLLADWLDAGLLGGPPQTVDDRLRSFSLEMHGVFQRERFPGRTLEYCDFCKVSLQLPLLCVSVIVGSKTFFEYVQVIGWVSCLG